jgi:hypothetical protein
MTDPSLPAGEEDKGCGSGEGRGEKQNAREGGGVDDRVVSGARIGGRQVGT